MTATTKDPTDYQITTQYLKQPTERFFTNIRLLHAAYAAGEIRNADFNDLKSSLSRFVYEAYRGLHNAQREKSSSAGKTGREKWNPDLNLYYQFGYSTPGNTHDLIAFRKKLEKQFAPLAKNDLYSEEMALIRALTDELHPIAIMLNSLKTKRIMGRAPRKELPPANPDQVTGYCAICFSRHAIRSGRMVHHGYERPGTGFQTDSCAGINYAPYERSDEGCKISLAYHQKGLRECEAQLQQKHTWKILYEVRQIREGRSYRSEMIKHTRKSPLWENLKQARITTIEQTAAHHTQRIDFYETKIKEWVLKPLRLADGTILPIEYDGTDSPPAKNAKSPE